MNVFLRICLIFIVLAVVVNGFQSKSDIPPAPVSLFDFHKQKRPAKAVRLAESFAQEFQATFDPATGLVPRERLTQAYQIFKKRASISDRSAIAGVEWKEKGPLNVAGRVRAMMLDPQDPQNNTMWAAGVSGGLWKTNDISVSDPDWVSVDDFFANLAITSMAYDPSDLAIRYFCTGEGFDNVDAVKGMGVWKSTDSGANWNWLSSTSSSDFDFCQKLVVTPDGSVLVATKAAGVKRSSNGGSSWSTVLDNSTGGASSDFAYDIEVMANGDILAALDGSIHKSTNDGASFGNAKSIPLSGSRIELATAPSNSSIAYAVIENAGKVEGLIKTSNGGNSWSQITEPSDATALVPNTDFSNGQAWYDLTLEVDPNDANVVITGGINLFKTTNGGSAWTQLTSWYNSGTYQIVHADQHAVVFQPGSSDVIYFGNDGGIYRTEDGSSSVPDLSRRNMGLNITQLTSVAAHPNAGSNYFLVGAQDNGSQRLNEPGLSGSWQFLTGDGGFHFIDEDQPQYQYASYIFNNFRRSTDGGKTWSVINYSNTGWFVNPSDYDDSNNIFYSAHNDKKYLRWNNPHSGNSFTEVTVNAFGNGGKVTAVAVSPNTPNRVYFGLDNGRVVRVNNANSGSASGTQINSGAGMPVGSISSIAIEEGSDNHILVTYSNYGVSSVWETRNGGSSWSDIEGNLPDMPVRWIIFSPSNNDMALIATEIGVWSTSDINSVSTNWAPSNSGMANVRTSMIKVRKSDKLLMAAAYGRGLFTSGSFSAPKADFFTKNRVHYIASPVRFKNISQSATSWFWDFGDGNTSTLEEPSHSYSNPGFYNVSLTINGGASSQNRNSYVQILPDKGTPYLEIEGGNFEANVNDFGSQAIEGNVNIWEHGSPSAPVNVLNSAPNGWKTSLDSVIFKDQYKCGLYSPSFNFSSVGSYSLGFMLSMQYVSCSGPFALQCQYSTDKGGSWTRLGVENDPNGTNWYNVGFNSGICKIPPTIFEDNYAWISWASNMPVSYDVSFLSGQANVAFRFVFAVSNDFGGGYFADGVLIDDFKVIGPPNGNSTPVPVEMSDLSADWKNEGASLNWKTFSEKNSLKFDVERSEDGIIFEKVGEVNAAGESNSEVSYDYFDGNLFRTVYHFRIKAVDLDGQSSYSNTVRLERETLGSVVLKSVYPVPFSSHLTLEFSGELENNGRIYLIDLQGKTLYESKLAQGKMEFELDDLSRISSGLLFLVVNRNGERLVRKILKR